MRSWREQAIENLGQELRFAVAFPITVGGAVLLCAKFYRVGSGLVDFGDSIYEGAILDG